MGGNQVRESCGLVVDALEEYMAQHGRPVEGSTLSDIAGELGLRRLRGNNFTNAITELKRHGDIKYSEEMREEKSDEGRREYRVITLSLP